MSLPRCWIAAIVNVYKMTTMWRILKMVRLGGQKRTEVADSVSSSRPTLRCVDRPLDLLHFPYDDTTTMATLVSLASAKILV